MLNQAIAANNQKVSAALPVHIKRTQLLSNGEEDPVLSHPSVQPLVNSLKQMAFAKNPNAEPAEINKQVAKYLRAMGSALHETSPEAVAARKTTAAQEQDWSAFL